MKYLISIFIITTLIVSGCSNNESENALKQENEQLKKENAKLLVEKEKLESDRTIDVSSEITQKMEQLNSEMGTLEAENEEKKKLITRYQKSFEHLSTKTNALSNILSIYNHEQVKEGSLIAGLIVSDVYKETANNSASYKVEFTGEFQVKGSIIHNVISDSKYSFIIEENLEKIPHTIEQFEKGSLSFDIENDEKLMEILGDKLEELPENGALEIEGIFKNYTYIYVPETDFPSSAEFVTLVSES